MPIETDNQPKVETVTTVFSPERPAHEILPPKDLNLRMEVKPLRLKDWTPDEWTKFGSLIRTGESIDEVHKKVLEARNQTGVSSETRNDLRREDLTPEENEILERELAGGTPLETALKNIEDERIIRDILGGGGEGPPRGPGTTDAGDPDGYTPEERADYEREIASGRTPEEARANIEGERMFRDTFGGGGATPPPSPRPPAPGAPAGGSGGGDELARAARALENLVDRLGGGRPPQPENPPPEEEDETLKAILKNAADGIEREEMKRVLQRESFAISSIDFLQLDPDTLWEVGYAKIGPMGLSPIKIPKRPEDKVTYVRDALAILELAGAESDPFAQDKVQRAQQLLEALRAPGYIRKQMGKEATDPDATKNKDLGASLYQELQARSILREKYIKFDTSDSVKTNAAIVRDVLATTMDTLFHTPEIALAFNIFEERFDEFLFTNIRGRDEIMASFRKELAEKLVDPNENPQYAVNKERYDAGLVTPQSQDPKEAYKSYDWAFRVAERLWHLWGNSAMHDKLRYKEAYEEYTSADPQGPQKAGGLTFASTHLPTGAGYNRRLFKLTDYTIAMQSSLSSHVDIVRGLDLNGGDYITKSLREVVQEHFEDERKKEFLITHGQSVANPSASWRAGSEQYATFMAKRDVEEIFGVPIEIKASDGTILVRGKEEVVEVKIKIKTVTDGVGQSREEVDLDKDGNALAEVVVREKMKRPRSVRPQGLILDGDDDEYDYDYTRNGEAPSPNQETRKITSKIKGTNWISRKIMGAGGNTSEYWDYSRTKWHLVRFANFFQTDKVMNAYSFDGLDYGDDFRTKLIAPGDPSAIARNPKPETLLSLGPVPKHKDNFENGKILTLNVVEYLAGPVAIEEGSSPLTETELMNLVVAAGTPIKAEWDKETGTKDSLYNPLWIEDVKKEAKKRIAMGRKRLEDFKRRQREAASRDPKHPLNQRRNEGLKDAAEMGGMAGLRFILALFGIRI